MAREVRLESLRRKHASLDDAIQAEASRRYPNDTLLHDLKRQKLRIKDEITRLST